MHDHALQNESQLVHNLSKGNLFAFNTLYKKFSSRLYRFALGYLKSKSEAEELVQEVFTIVWDKRKDLKETFSIKSYLFTIAFNIIRKHFRTKMYLCEYFKTSGYDDLDIRTSQKIAYDSLYQYLTILVNQLPVRRKEIFIKSRFEGYSINEIADDMNISHKTVENQLTDALKFLRRNLKSESITVILYFFLFIN